MLYYDRVMGSNDNGRYIFNITGNIKEIIYPSKAIISFRGKDGKEENAILLVHKVIVNGNYVDEHKLMSEVMATGDLVEFDGHVYDYEVWAKGLNSTPALWICDVCAVDLR